MKGPITMRLFQFVILFLLVTLPFAVAMAQESSPVLTPEAVNAADLNTVPAEFLPPPAAGETTGSDAVLPPAAPDPAIVKLQVLLDQAGASPGVIDGFDGDNVRKAVTAFETMAGLT